MVTVDKSVIAKIEKNGKHFEILVDPEIAYELKQGKTISVSKMLAINEIYTDSKKGMKASEKDIEEAFGTTDIETIASVIVKTGDVQITTSFRREKIEEKKREIASIISKYAHNPKTKLPHPQDRILAAMEQTHVSVDPFKPATQQIEYVIRALKDVIPISVEEINLKITVSARYSGTVFNAIKKIGNVKKQDWLSDGSLQAVVSLPSGLKDNIYKTLNSSTEGTIRIEEIQ